MSLEDKIQQARALLGKAKHAIALTGAGISTPSGIPDFRSPGSGFWEKVDPFQVASLYGFSRRPQDFYDWIHPLIKLTRLAKPNAAHLALAALEQYGPLRGIITQNIDMLHHKAGSEMVYEIHGHMREMTCLRCYQVVVADTIIETFLETQVVPRCPECQGVLKPNVILFGEQLPVRILEKAKQQTRLCDVMLVVGSSLGVAPVCDLPLEAVHNGARLIIVNYEETYADRYADVVIHADVVEVLPQLAPLLNEQPPKVR